MYRRTSNCSFIDLINLDSAILKVNEYLNASVGKDEYFIFNKDSNIITLVIVNSIYFDFIIEKFFNDGGYAFTYKLINIRSKQNSIYTTYNKMYKITSSENMNYISNSNLLLKDNSNIVENMESDSKNNKIIRNQFFKELINNNYESCREIYKLTVNNSNYKNKIEKKDIDDLKMSNELLDRDIINSKHFIVFLKNTFDFEQINRNIAQSIVNDSSSIYEAKINTDNDSQSDSINKFKIFSLKTLGLINLYYILYVDIVYFLKYTFKDCLFRSIKLTSESKLNLDIVFPKKTEILRHNTIVLKDKLKNLFNQVEVNFNCSLIRKNKDSDKENNKTNKINSNENQNQELSEFYKNLSDYFNQNFNSNGTPFSVKQKSIKNDIFLSKLQVVSFTDLLFLYNIEPLYIANKKTNVTFKDIIISEGFNFEEYGKSSIMNAKKVKISLLLHFLKSENYFKYCQICYQNISDKDINPPWLGIMCFNSSKFNFRYVVNPLGLFEFQDERNLLSDLKWNIADKDNNVLNEMDDTSRIIESNIIHINNHYNYFFNKIEEVQSIVDYDGAEMHNKSSSELFIQTLNSIANLRMFSLKNNTFRELDNLIANNVLSSTLTKMNIIKSNQNFLYDSNKFTITVGLDKFDKEKLCFLKLIFTVEIKENYFFKVENIEFQKTSHEEEESLSLKQFLNFNAYKDYCSLLSDIYLFRTKNHIVEILNILVKRFSFSLKSIVPELDKSNSNYSTLSNLTFSKINISLSEQIIFYKYICENSKNGDFDFVKKCLSTFESISFDISNLNNFSFDIFINMARIREITHDSFKFSEFNLKTLNNKLYKENVNEAQSFNIRYISQNSNSSKRIDTNGSKSCIRYENIYCERYPIRVVILHYMISIIYKQMQFCCILYRLLCSESNFLNSFANILKLSGNKSMYEKINKCKKISEIEDMKLFPFGMCLLKEDALSMCLVMDYSSDFKFCIKIGNSIESIYDNKSKKFNVLNGNVDIQLCNYLTKRVKFVIFKNTIKENVANDVLRINKPKKFNIMLNSHDSILLPLSILVCLKENLVKSEIKLYLKYVSPLNKSVFTIFSEQECRLEMLNMNNFNFSIYESDGKILVKIVAENNDKKLDINNKLMATNNKMTTGMPSITNSTPNKESNSFLSLKESGINQTNLSISKEFNLLIKLSNHCKFNHKLNAFEIKDATKMKNVFNNLEKIDELQINSFSKFLKDILYS